MVESSTLSEKIIRYYIPFSVRSIVYSSIANFTKISKPVFSQLSLTYGKTIFFIMDIIFFEIINYLTKKDYKPNFIKASQEENKTNTEANKKQIVLNEKDYDFRCQLEIYIFSLLRFFLFNLVLSLIALSFSFDTTFIDDILIGTFGFILVLVFNFISIVLLVSKIEHKEASIFYKILGAVSQIFVMIYIYFRIINYR